MLSRLVAPFAGSHSEAFLEQVAEKAHVLVTTLVGNIRDGIVGLHEQLPRMPEAQFRLMHMKRHAEFLPEQAAKMTYAAIQLLRQVRMLEQLVTDPSLVTLALIKGIFR